MQDLECRGPLARETSNIPINYFRYKRGRRTCKANTPQNADSRKVLHIITEDFFQCTASFTFKQAFVKPFVLTRLSECIYGLPKTQEYSQPGCANCKNMLPGVSIPDHSIHSTFETQFRGTACEPRLKALATNHGANRLVTFEDVAGDISSYREHDRGG
jgi:hypothetical protein